MKALSIIPVPLPSVSWSSLGTATTDLRRLPTRVFGRIAHLAGITFDVENTYTATSPTVTVLQMNNIVSRMEIFDGAQVRFSGRGFNALRLFERLEHMRPIVNEAQLVSPASGDVFAFARHWPVAPLTMAGAPSDFVIPCAGLQSGEIRYTFGAITDIGGGTTPSAVITIRPTAWVVLLDELRIPPFVERMEYDTASADNPISGKGLLMTLGVCNDTAFGAIAAADFSSITVETGTGQLVPAVDAEVLTHTYQYLMLSGQLGAVYGETRNAANDLPPRGIDPASGTALIAVTEDLQPIFISPHGCQLSKLPYIDSQLRVRWSGGSTTSPILVTRVLEQTPEAIASFAAKCSDVLGVKLNAIKIKTLSKQPYVGPLKGFMPYKGAVS